MAGAIWAGAIYKTQMVFSVYNQLADISNQLGKLEKIVDIERKKQNELNERLEGLSFKKSFLKESVIDFRYTFSKMPKNITFQGITYNQNLNENQKTENGIPYVDGVIKLNFGDDYLTFLAVFLDWIAYSKIPLTVESLEINGGKNAVIGFRIYGIV